MTDRPRGAPGASPTSLLAGLVVFALVSVDVVVGGPLSRLDERLSRWTRTSGVSGHGWLDLPTEFGDRVVAGVFVTLAVALLAGRARTVVPLVRLAVLGLAVVGTVIPLKIAFHRPPPGGVSGEVLRSYPSGHTATAVVLYGLLAALAAQYATSALVRRLTRVLAVLAPVLTMVGMLLRDYHWLSDLLGAAALGVVLLQAERLVLGHWLGARRGSAAGPGGAAAGTVPARPGGG